MKSMELASAEYVILLGDDDRINEGSLKKIIEFLELHQDTGVVIDSYDFKNKTTNREIDLKDLLRNYYWNMGNAGVFIVKSSFVKESLRRYGTVYFNENWSQTQFMILGLYGNKNLKAYIINLNIISHTLHSEFTIYNSFYLWRAGYYELFIAIKPLEKTLDKDTIKPAYDYLKENIIQFVLYNVLQYGVFIDDTEIRIKTRDHILKNLRLFSLYESLILWILIIALSIPNKLAKFFSNIFIFLIKGKSGLNKKNEFIRKEIEKNNAAKKMDTKSIRKLEYEIDNY
jgi:hypothetical protein